MFNSHRALCLYQQKESTFALSGNQLVWLYRTSEGQAHRNCAGAAYIYL